MDKYFKKFTFHPKLYVSSFPGDSRERNILLWEWNNVGLRWELYRPYRNCLEDEVLRAAGFISASMEESKGRFVNLGATVIVS